MVILFTFFDGDNQKNEIVSILSTTRAWANIILAGKHESPRHFTTDFNENVIANKFSFSLIILRSGESLTSFIIYNHVNFSGEKK